MNKQNLTGILIIARIHYSVRTVEHTDYIVKIDIALFALQTVKQTS